MKITVICSTSRKKTSSTYNLAKQVANKLSVDDEPSYFFLPKDFSHFCCGCMQCFSGLNEKCLGYEQLKPIKESFNKSQLIIFAVPVYVYHAPGQLKALLDHFGCEWLVHQPNGLMFKKQALIISTAAGAGMKSTIKDVKDSLDFWGVGRVYTYKKAIAAANWTEIPLVKQAKMLKCVESIADRILKDSYTFHPRFKVKFMFWACRLMHKYKHFNPTDVEHWKKNGWLDRNRPWNNH